MVLMSIPLHRLPVGFLNIYLSMGQCSTALHIQGVPAVLQAMSNGACHLWYHICVTVLSTVMNIVSVSHIATVLSGILQAMTFSKSPCTKPLFTLFMTSHVTQLKSVLLSLGTVITIRYLSNLCTLFSVIKHRPACFKF